MKPIEFTRSVLKYLFKTEPGSIVDTVRNRQPEISDGETNTDLHTHPYISSIEDFYDTLDVLVRNNVGICSITTHGRSYSRELDFWNVKEMVKKTNLDYKDQGLAFQVRHKGKNLTFVGSYEVYVVLDGVKGEIDIVSLMPDKGFEDFAKVGMRFEDHLKMNRDHGAIVIGAHPYTISSSRRGFFKILKFVLADEEERERIKGDFFPEVDVVDMVSTNTLWMSRSNELVERDYKETMKRRPLATSDAHSQNHYTREETGRSGTVFQLQGYKTGEELREQLRNRIVSDRFRTYFNYTPSSQFLGCVALGKHPEGFP